MGGRESVIIYKTIISLYVDKTKVLVMVSLVKLMNYRDQI